LIFAFTLAGLAYGALYLAAWNYPFTSNVERVMWRESGVAIAASGPLVVLGLPVYILTDYLDARRWRDYTPYDFELLEDALPNSRYGETMTIMFTSRYILERLGTVACVLAYICNRVYLVLDCYLTFPYLPDASFEQAQWSRYFPHIT
jgi:hypothetical protein